MDKVEVKMRKRKSLTLKKILLVLLFMVAFIFIFSIVFEKHWNGILSEFQKNFYAVGYINITDWKRLKYEGCNGHFIGYGHQFAVLKDVALIPNDDKFYMSCPKLPKYHFKYGKEGTHLNGWMEKIESIDNMGQEKLVSKGAKHKVSDKLTVAVLRYEYANFYHTVTDWYNVFILTKLLNEPIHDIGVILYDQNAKGHLDETWTTLFKDVIFRQNLTATTFYKKLAWNILGYESPINFHATLSLPYLLDFHDFFIRQHGIQEAKSLDCSQLIITFIWRRDYVAHPGNPTGLISRKVKNDEELVSHLKKVFPKALVKEIQLDQHSMKEQLEVITNTDILISMHGAGLAHVLFLPHHAGVVEMFPIYWKKYFGASHFRAMAKWRKLQYSAWQNLNPSNEFDKFYTYVPPLALESHVRPIYKQMCPTL